MSSDHTTNNSHIRLTFKDRIFLIILRLIGQLSLASVHKFCNIVYGLTKIMPFKFKRVIATHIRLCFPDLTKQQQDDLIKHSIKNTLYCLAEMPMVWFSAPEKVLKYVTQVSGKDAIMKATDEGKSIIILAPHLGSWEIMNFYGSSLHPSACLYKPRKKAYQEIIIRESREKSGILMLPTTSAGVIGLYRALVEKKWVGILADHDPGKNGGVFVPFFGISANTMTLVSKLAAKSKATVFLAFAERLPHSQGFHIHFKEASSLIANDDLKLGATIMNQEIEQLIRIAPSQYEWSYKRFRRRPNNEPSLYQ